MSIEMIAGLFLSTVPVLDAQRFPCNLRWAGARRFRSRDVNDHPSFRTYQRTEALVGIGCICNNAVRMSSLVITQSLSKFATISFMNLSVIDNAFC